jgi:hypothetical protein
MSHENVVCARVKSTPMAIETTRFELVAYSRSHIRALLEADNDAHSGCLAGIGEVVTGGFAASATGSAGFTRAGSAVAAGLGASAAGPGVVALPAAAVLVLDCPASGARGFLIFPFDFWGAGAVATASLGGGATTGSVTYFVPSGSK